MTGPANFKVKPFRSAAYRRFVKALKCCVPGCPFPADDPHHEQAEAQGGMGTTPCDSRCVPLCRGHHDIRQHGWMGRAVWHYWGIDPEQVITATQERWFQKFGNKPWEGR